MGVSAPIPKNEARLVLATNAAQRAVSGEWNVFNEATHIRIHLCHWDEVPLALKPIIELSTESKHAPKDKWGQLEKRLREAMSDFLKARQ
jgi:hypothetical protein